MVPLTAHRGQRQLARGNHWEDRFLGGGASKLISKLAGSWCGATAGFIGRAVITDAAERYSHGQTCQECRRTQQNTHVGTHMVTMKRKKVKSSFI